MADQNVPIYMVFDMYTIILVVGCMAQDTNEKHVKEYQRENISLVHSVGDLK